MDAGNLTSGEALMLMAAFSLAALGVLAWRRSVGCYLAMVVVAVAFSRIRVDIGALTVGADQLATVGLLFPLFGAAARIERQRYQTHRLLGMLLLAYVVLGALSSMISGHGPGQALRSAAIMGVAVAAFWSPRLLVCRGLSITRLSRCLVVVAAVVGALATILGGFSYLFGSAMPGVQVDPVNASLYLAYVSFYEANLLGAFLGAALILVLFEPSMFARRSSVRTSAQAAVACGLVATLTRGSWVAFLVGAAVVVVLSRRSVGHGRDVGKIALLVIFLAGGVSLSGPVRVTVATRLRGIFDFSTGSGFGRTQILERAVDAWRESPVIGHGFLSFEGRLPGSAAGADAWIPNHAVAVLHDTGVVGAVLMILFLGVLLTRLRRARASTSSVPWLGVIVCLFVASQATQAQVLPFFWFLIGIAALVADQGAKSRPDAATSTAQRAMMKAHG